MKKNVAERRESDGLVMIQSEIIKNITESVFLVDMKDGLIKWTNDEFENLFGYFKGEILGKPVSTL